MRELQNNTEGNANVAVGEQALLSNTIGSGVTGFAGETNRTWIRNIWGQPGATQAVYVDSAGRLRANTSSRRFKEEIRPMDTASEVIYSLKPVSFRYKSEIEPTHPLSFGLIAEDVEQINADLVLHGKDGRVSTVRYEADNAMFLNEFLKEDKKVEQLESTVATLAATVKQQQRKSKGECPASDWRIYAANCCQQTLKRKGLGYMKIMTSLISGSLTGRFLQSKLIFVVLAVPCLTVLPKSLAVVPPPDGGYPGFNTAEGQNALFSLTAGAANTAVGWYSLFSDKSGGFNTALGAGTLLFNNADSNTAVGTAALLLNTVGSNNTAIGTSALSNNTVGYSNTAIGEGALFSNTEGRLNTAIGETALVSNSTGQLNTAVAAGALNRNTTGENNTAVGYAALLGNTTGDTNTAVGSFALNSMDTGIGNSAMGANALAINTTGFFNTAIGNAALSENAGTLNTALGYHAGINNTGGSVNIYIGNEGGGPNESNVMRLGRKGDGPTLFTYIAGIFGSNVSGAAVYIDSDGQLGTVNSSRRFKHDIKPMDKASEAILSLKPVTFHYNSDTKASPQFGLIAEEVAEVNPNLVVRDNNGDLLSVRYDQVNAMLLNEFIKEHRKVQKLEAALEAMNVRLNKQSTELQQVRTQVERNSAPQLASRD